MRPIAYNPQTAYLMKKISFKKLLFKGMVALAFVFLVLVGYILNPSLSYAHQTDIEGLRVFHNQELAPQLQDIVRESLNTLKSSELYDPQFQMELCTQESSTYAKIIEILLGEDIIRAFSNKNVVLLPTDESGTTFTWRGNRFNYVQALAHAMVHNLQYNHHGFWDANPLGMHPVWKWEGYAEYVVLGKKYSLQKLLAKYEQAGPEMFTFVSLQDGEGTIRLHIRFLILTKYCLENKGMSYGEFMRTSEDEDSLWQEIKSTQP